MKKPNLFLSASKNVAYNFANLLLSLVVSVWISIVLARQLTPSVYGDYSYLMFIVTLSANIFSFGMFTSLPKLISEHLGRGEVKMASRISSFGTNWGILLGLIGAAAAYFTMSFISVRAGSSGLMPVIVASAIVLPLILINIQRGALMGYQNYKGIFLANLVFFTAQALITQLLLSIRPGLTTALVSLGSSYLFAVLCYSFVLFKKSRTEYNKTRDERFGLSVFYRYAGVVAIISLIDIIVWQYSEVLFLGAYRPSQEVAFYTVAFNLSSVAASTFPGAIIGVLLPLLSSLVGENSRESLLKVFKIATKYVALLVGVIVGVFCLNAQGIINILYGVNYEPAARILPFLISSAGLGSISAVAAALIYADKKPGIILRLMSVVLVINLSLDYILIPKYGVVGATFANVSAQLVASLLTFMAMYREYDLKNINSRMLIRYLASVLPVFALPALVNIYSNNSLLIAASTVLGILIFLVAIVNLRVLNGDDKLMFRQLEDILPKKLAPPFLLLINKVKD